MTASNSIDVRDERMRENFGDVAVEEVQGGFQFLEGPVWIAARSELVFSDMAGDCMYRLDVAGEVREYRSPSNKANGNTLDRQGRLVTCEHATSRVVREETNGRLTVIADYYGNRELNSPNDVIVAPDGTVLFSDPTFGREEFFGVPRPESQEMRAVYAVDPAAGSVRRICDGFLQPNGLCLSNDGRYLYVNDTERGHIKRFTYVGGAASDGVVFAEVNGDGEGSPDGMKVDREGNVFCTGPGGLHVYTADGVLLGIVRVPNAIANFTWGDDDLRTIYLCGGSTLYRVRTLRPGPVLASS